MLLTTWLNSWESIYQPANFAHLLILPFSVFPLHAHTGLVKGHFLMLRRQSGTHSLTKSGHPNPIPSHSSNHSLKLIFFSSPTDCVCQRGRRDGEWGRGRERGRERGERVRASGLLQSVRGFFVLFLFCFVFPLILFHVMGFVLRRRNGTEKRTYYYH